MELTKYKKKVRASIQQLEDSLITMQSQNDNIFVGDTENSPLTHHFTDGLYGREILLKKGTAAIGKLHKKDCFVFIMSGEVKVVTEDGNKEAKGPCMFISKAGNKKVVYAITDVIWIDVYSNEGNSEDLQIIENNVIAKNYLEYEEFKQLKN